jgi:hypothetical protein
MLIKRLSGAAAVIGLGLFVLPAQAAFVVVLQEEAGNVIATGSGAFDLADLTKTGTFNDVAQISPSSGAIGTGPTVGSEDYYMPPIGFGVSGPSNFGGGFLTPASSGSGDLVGFDPSLPEPIRVPSGYVSESPLAGASTYDNQTFASLGVTAGIYMWTWGSGSTADSFTLDIVAPAPSTVPEPSTWIMMLAGFVGVGLAGYRASRRTAAADA